VTLSADTFAFVVDLVRRRSAIDLIAGKEYLVESRLEPLARQAGLTGVDEYVQTLRMVPYGVEHDRIVEALTTNETSWFRDINAFRALTGQIIPALILDRPGLTSVRVWSAGCSTGQEPYSIAMALLDAAPDLAVSIVATDISQEVLRCARAGLYSQFELNRGLPAAMLVRHFGRVGTGWQLSQEVRSRVAFSQHNLLDSPPRGAPFDVIFLRNVLFYFDLESRAKVLRQLREAIRPGGFLLLGGVETLLGIDDSWERVPAERCTFYRFGDRRAA